MLLWILFHLIVFGLLFMTKWNFWARGRKRYLKLAPIVWGAFFLLSIPSLRACLDQWDFLAYFALPFLLAQAGFFDINTIGLTLFSVLLLASFFLLPIWSFRRDPTAREQKGRVWKCSLLDFFLYFSLLPSILLAFGQFFLYGNEPPGVRDPLVWKALLFYPAFWGVGILDALISAGILSKRVERDRGSGERA